MNLLTARADSLSAVEHRPADVVSQPLVVHYYKLANRLRKLFALPLAFQPASALARALGRSQWID